MQVMQKSVSHFRYSWWESQGITKILLVMKLTVLLLTVAFLNVEARTTAQNITLSGKKMSLQKVFTTIKKQTGYVVLTTKNLLNDATPISINAYNMPLTDFLDAALRDQPLHYRIEGKTIMLTRRPSGKSVTPELIAVPLLIPPGIDVTILVQNMNGQPLLGASIRVKGTQRGISTDANGSAVLKAVDPNATLLISYTGYTDIEIAINKRTELNVKLTAVVSALDDIVVVGYGTRKKSDVTGAVASIGAEEIRKRPVANALQAMQGKIAGVDITSNERPGELGNILIRGVRSLSATNTPLYVVDGIPLTASGIESLNPNDIESIDILKDASATAIYGSRGANGVVLITTKQGKSGKLSMNYIGTTTIEKMYDRTEMMNSSQYIDFRRAAYRRAGNYPTTPTVADDQRIFGQTDPYSWKNIAKGWASGTWNGNLVPTTDWTGMVLKTGVTTDHLLSVSGGTDKIKTYASFGFLSQGGTQAGQDYKRYSGKFTSELKPLKWFKMGGSINATYGIQNYGYATTNATGPGNIYFAAQGMLPYAVPYDSTGKRINEPGGDVNILNPIDEDKYCINLRKVLRTMGTIYAEAEIIKGLRYRIDFGPDFYNRYNGRWMDANSVNRGGGEPGSTNYAQLNQTSTFAWTLDNLLYYDKTFGKHTIGVTLLQTASDTRQETSSMTATNLPWNSQKWYQLNSVSALDNFSSGLTETQLSSYMGRINYGFNNKYLLTVSARWDGASQLADGHKWDFFPSAALAWRIDQENFIKNTNWINLLKLRLGYGSTGNSAISAYQTKGGVQTLYYTWGSTVQAGYVSSDASLATPAPMANLGLGWEHTSQWNLGLDFGVLKGRITGAIDIYASKTTDLLLLMNIPSVTGYTTTYANVGATNNKGIDVTLNTINIKTRDFTWTSGLNFSASKDKIVSLNNGIQKDYTNLWFVGQRNGIYYDYVKTGIWQNTATDIAEMAKFAANGNTFKAGDIKIADLNGDYKIDANNDRAIRGHSNPDWVCGFNNTFNYKNWELSVSMYARWGFTIATGAESLQGRFAQRVLNYWTPDNPTNDYPSPNYNSAAGDTYKSSMNYQDASFIKIRNISLGYTFTDKVIGKLRMSNCKVYAQITNPGLLYSKVSWIDPDLGGSTFNRGIVLGVNIGF